MISESEELFADWLASEGIVLEDERRDPWPESIATPLAARAEAAALAAVAVEILERRRADYDRACVELAAVLERVATTREALARATELAASAGVHFALVREAA